MPTINKLHRIKERTVDYPHSNDIASQYYNTSRWHNLRDRYIKQHPFCEECEKKGKTKLAEQVHHIVEFMKGKTDEERWNLLLDEDNLMSLCCECHKEKHYGKRNDGEMENNPPSIQKN